MAEDEIDDEILSRYYIWSQLGKGAYGIVWKAVDKLRPNRVRLEQIDLDYFISSRYRLIFSCLLDYPFSHCRLLL